MHFVRDRVQRAQQPRNQPRKLFPASPVPQKRTGEKAQYRILGKVRRLAHVKLHTVDYGGLLRRVQRIVFGIEYI